MNDEYAERLARQAVIVTLAKRRYEAELAYMDSIVKGTPPYLFPSTAPEKP